MSPYVRTKPSGISRTRATIRSARAACAGRKESLEPLIERPPRNVPSVTGAVTSERKRAVERYIDGFRTGDRELIHSCLTDDVVWEMPPHFQLSGRAAFDGAIQNEATPGLPTIRLIRLVEEGDVVVAEGAVQAELKAGGRIDALFCDVFQFRDDKICRLVTYQVDRRPDEGTRRGFEL
jgi:uncharacterized protein